MSHMSSLALSELHGVLSQLIWFRFQLWAFKTSCGKLKCSGLGGPSLIFLFKVIAFLKHHRIFWGHFFEKKLIEKKFYLYQVGI